MFVPAVSLHSRRLTDTPNKTYSFWSELVVWFWNPLRLCCLNHCSSPSGRFSVRNKRLKVQHSPFVPARITLLTYSTLRSLFVWLHCFQKKVAFCVRDNSKNWLAQLTTPHFNFLHDFYLLDYIQYTKSHLTQRKRMGYLHQWTYRIM